MHGTDTQFESVKNHATKPMGVQHMHVHYQKHMKATHILGEYKERDMGILWLAPKLHNTLCIWWNSLAVVSTFTFLGQWLKGLLFYLLHFNKNKKAFRASGSKNIARNKCKNRCSDSAAQIFPLGKCMHESKRPFSFARWSTKRCKKCSRRLIPAIRAATTEWCHNVKQLVFPKQETEVLYKFWLHKHSWGTKQPGYTCPLVQYTLQL